MKNSNKDENLEKAQIQRISSAKRPLVWLSFFSFLLALVFIAIAFVSIKRIETVQSPAFPVCLIRETPLYITIHNLSAIIPVIAILTGLLALYRIIKSRKIRFDFALAFAGIAVSVITLTIYWFELNHLAEHSH
ncbi:MAG: hypothetical protein ACYSRQ_06790 [Planctomycetota bacterium]|jgi:uncharacterized BrkB/YihY/UPF0761 family membrane protein